LDPLTRAEGIAAPLPIDNVDTDAIIPSRETQTVSRDGYGERLFANWRYEPGTRIVNPSFVLNREPFDHAVIMVTGANFGCGSSREAAVWALKQFGIRCVIAPSFGAIFYNNCVRNGLLPVVLSGTQTACINRAAARAEAVRVDLERMVVLLADGEQFNFYLAARDREMLLTGADEIEFTLRLSRQIEKFRARDQVDRPWLYRERPLGK
jgi:3-isopropylmalate/(R)-2-methylmalate dehydratase small subunit